MKSGISKTMTRLAALLLGVVMLPPYAAADSKMSFKDLDANKDGYLSQEEFKAKGKDDLAFKAADLDGDGRVDPGEFDKYKAKKAADKKPTEQPMSEPGAMQPMQPKPAQPSGGGY